MFFFKPSGDLKTLGFLMVSGGIKRNTGLKWVKLWKPCWLQLCSSEFFTNTQSNWLFRFILANPAWFSDISRLHTGWKVSVFWVFMIRIFSLLYWILSPNVGKYGPEKLLIRTHFTQWQATHNFHYDNCFIFVAGKFHCFRDSTFKVLHSKF